MRKKYKKLFVCVLLLSIFVHSKIYADCIVNNTTYFITDNVQDMTSMFRGATAFNQNLSQWDTGKVTNMSNMFRDATAFNQDISGWNTSAVNYLSNMFRNSNFNNDITTWDTSNVTLMKSMFQDNSNFNGNILSWDTNNVRNMSKMFRNAISFNRPIGSWDTGSVNNMSNMFNGATNFNQDIRSWDVSCDADLQNMFRNTNNGSEYNDTPNCTFFENNNVPTLVSTVPNTNSNNVTANIDIVLNFSENIFTEEGEYINIYRASDDSLFESINVNSLKVTGSGTSKITINPNNFKANLEYYVQITNNIFKDTASSYFAGIQSITAFSFIIESTPPTISSISIASNNSTTTQAVPDDVVTLTFTASETIAIPVVTFKSGGDTVTDTSITYTNSSGNTWTAAYTASASDTVGAVTFSIAYSDIAGNVGGAGNVGTAVTSTTDLTSVSFMLIPSVAFAGVKADVESKMAANARTQLNDFATSTFSIVGSARSRLMNTSGLADSSDTALSGGVSSDSSDLKGSTKRVTTTADSQVTSIIEVQYQHTETKEGLKSQNASGQIIWEQKLSGTLTFGRFLGVSLGDGDAVGTNNIAIEFMGAQAGAYLVGNTKGGLVYDTYFAGSVIENKMGVTTSLMTADTKYYSSMLTTGVSVTRSIQVKKVEIRPTFSTDVSYIFGETADFVVTVGLAKSVEQAAYGDISKAQITFAPEFRLPFTFGGSFWDDTLGNLWDGDSVLTFTPKVKCRYLKQGTATEDCGQGLSLGFKANSNDGLLNLTAKAGMDRVGSEITSTLKLQFEQKF